MPDCRWPGFGYNSRMSDSSSTAPSALSAIRNRIARAAAAAGRPVDGITLVAVSKTFGADVISPVIAEGQRVFGENRVQEAKGKWPELCAQHRGIELHLIGPLQTNKVRDALHLFDVIHTLDRPRLAQVLADEIGRSGRTPGLFVQVNTGAEPQKAGVSVEGLPAFLDLCRETHRLPVQGLMCIPPVHEQAGPHFALLSELARRYGLAKLSMGMSGDFEDAIAHGATHVRVGSAIFGAR